MWGSQFIELKRYVVAMHGVDDLACWLTLIGGPSTILLAIKRDPKHGGTKLGGDPASCLPTLLIFWVPTGSAPVQRAHAAEEQ